MLPLALLLVVACGMLSLPQLDAESIPAAIAGLAALAAAGAALCVLDLARRVADLIREIRR